MRFFLYSRPVGPQSSLEARLTPALLFYNIESSADWREGYTELQDSLVRSEIKEHARR